MHASYGWMTTKSNAEVADTHVAKLLKDSKRARKSLFHAARLFRLIREHGIVALYDPFCMLTAVQYISKYTTHLLDRPHEGSEHTSLQAHGQPIRIDRLNSEEQDAWIQGDERYREESPIHITGIGVLQKSGSSTRAFKEAASILRGSVAWTKISEGIAHALIQSLRGEDPRILAS